VRALKPIVVALVLCLVCAAPALARPAAGAFAPERPFAFGWDDWEPSVVADGAGRVLVFTTRYGAEPLCGDCPEHRIVYRRSTDRGRTFGPVRTLCRCPGFGGQNDPVAVADRRNRLFVTWMNDFHVSFARSLDGGRTWSRYVRLDRGLPWSDKPWIGASPSGRHVYVVFNAPTLGDPWAVASHDAGRTWTRPIRILRGPRYFFSGGVAVLDDGTVLSAQNAYAQDYTGDVHMVLVRSTDGGRSWSHRRLGRSREARPCPPAAQCPDGFLGAQDTIAADARGRLYLLWSSSTRPRGPARLLLRRSDDGGASWSAPRSVGTGGPRADHGFPMIAAAGHGDVRIAWMEERAGWWNTWFRRSDDGGATWSASVRLSDRAGGAPYKSRRGFRFPYGDYGQLAIGAGGVSHAAWGEGPSYAGPGDTWYARSR
jgi:hypothetical protein